MDFALSRFLHDVCLGFVNTRAHTPTPVAAAIALHDPDTQNIRDRGKCTEAICLERKMDRKKEKERETAALAFSLEANGILGKENPKRDTVRVEECSSLFMKLDEASLGFDSSHRLLELAGGCMCTGRPLLLYHVLCLS